MINLRVSPAVMIRRLFSAFALAALAAACTPRVEPAGPVVAEPRLDGGHLVAADGAVLPLRRWMPEGPPKAVLVGLHGMNDYSNAFALPAEELTKSGIAVYAYDQRGFGAAPHRGIWPGTATLVADARAAAALVKRSYPDVPVYFLGVSMGGAVALLATTGPDTPAVDGAILVGPAVRGRRHIGAVPRAVLWFMSRTVPWLPLTGEGVQIQPSDNIQMLRALGRDPLVLKQTRVDAVHGLVDLMDAALEAGPRVRVPTLVMFGLRDELVPETPTLDLLSRLPPAGPARAAAYRNGYHMLLRDLGAEVPLGDIAAWAANPAAPLPSGADETARKYVARHAKPETQTSAHIR